MTEYRHRIMGPEGPIAVYTKKSDGTAATYYLTHDHQGSPDRIVQAIGGNVHVTESFGAWGERRSPGTWSGPPTSTDVGLIRQASTDGYTGHEQLDYQALIHMNGRVYDPVIGRFLSPDPYVQAPGNGQSFNRYSYVFNNPLKYTDPSGYEADIYGAGPWITWDWDFGGRSRSWSFVLYAPFGGNPNSPDILFPGPRGGPLTRVNPRVRLLLEPYGNHLAPTAERSAGGVSRVTEADGARTVDVFVYNDGFGAVYLPVPDDKVAELERALDQQRNEALIGTATLYPAGRLAKLLAEWRAAWNSYRRIPKARGADETAKSANAADALARKLAALEKAQAGAARTRTLADGRIRHYSAETPARNPGATRGASLVTEHNPRTGQVRQWMETYDHAGNVTRVHPKMIDGRVLDAPHYPPTGAELAR